MLKFLTLAIALSFMIGIVSAGPLEFCGKGARINCLVDGDTIWIDGKKLRLTGYDTPEPTTNICGGKAEIALAKKASARVLDLLNTQSWGVKYSGKFDKYDRELVSIDVAGQDLGAILIAERLARKFPNGDEFWCKK